MRILISLIIMGMFVACVSDAATLEKIAEFKGNQVTGVTISDSGRIFVNFPRWRDTIPYSVAELDAQGNAKPYPNELWNKWSGKPEDDTFTCVQSVVADGNSLFVLDPSSPLMKGVVGHATLYEFDLATNKLKQKWVFDTKIAPKTSYLNDLRVDRKMQKIYMTDSGTGGLVVIDLIKNQPRRYLDPDKSTAAENVKLTINGKVFKKDGKPARIASDGIALRDGYLYWHALTGKHLYRISTTAFDDDFNKVKEQVQDLGSTPSPDGMIFDDQGNLYMADLEKNAIVYRTPKGELKTLIQDPNLKWADTFALDRRTNSLLVTDSKLDDAPAGMPVPQMNFPVYKIKL